MKKLSFGKENVSKRDSAVELLRIISMVMIVFHHFARHGEFQFFEYDLTMTKLWYNFIIMGGKIGVNIFVLITGYFLINNKSIFNFHRIKKIWDQVFFYSIGFEIFFIGLYFIVKGRLDFSNLLDAIFPITTSRWWFASTYIALYLIHPFVNQILLSLSKKIYQNILMVATFLWCVIPTFTQQCFESNNLLWFVFIYSLAGYIRLYGFNSKIKTWHYAITAVMMTIITYLSSVVISVLATKISMVNLPSTYFYEMQTLPVLILSVCLFMAFTTVKMKNCGIINVVASATFGVYLIHENHYVRNIFWQTIFDNASYQNTIQIIPISIVSVFIVYVICTLIELFRQLFIEKTFTKMTDVLLVPFKKMILGARNRISLLFCEIFEETK